MNRVDLPAFETLMQEIAECYDHKPYGTGALKHWVEALSEFPYSKVRHRLILWRDSKPKIPTIADILPGLRNTASEELEKKAEEDKKIFAKAYTPVTPFGEECMAKIRTMLANHRPPGRWWAYELRDRHRKGELLSITQLEMAQHACGLDWDSDRPYRAPNRIERIPGEDDQ